MPENLKKEFWSEWLYFLLFFPKANKKYARFPLLNSFCKTNHLGDFSGPGDLFLDFWSELFFFLFPAKKKLISIVERFRAKD